MNPTPVQRRMLHILSSGLPVARHELLKALDNPSAKLHNLHSHITLLRAYLLRINENIVCRVHRGSFYYQHVKMLTEEAAKAEMGS